MSDARDPDFECPSAEESLTEEDNPDPTPQMKRKRRKTKNPAEWKQNIPRDKRLKGLAHESRRGLEREGRALGPKCESNYCVKSKFRDCNKIEDLQCERIFSDFWSLVSWEERKRIINALTHRWLMRPLAPAENPPRSCSCARMRPLGNHGAMFV